MATCLPWIVEADLLAVCPVAEEAQDDLITRAILWATDVLYKRTRGRYGVCSYTAKICPPSGCGFCPCECGPRALLEVSPSKPISVITSVTNALTAVVIDPSRYTIVNDRWIGLTDRVNCGWTLDYAPELIVVFGAGNVPDAEAKEACCELAGEWLNKKLGKECRLPLKENSLSGYRRGRGGRRDVILFNIPFVDQFILAATSGSPSGMLDPAAARPYSGV